MRILGIDPGSTVTGFGVVERRAGQVLHVAHGTVRPPQGAPLALRLQAVYEAVREICECHAPDVASVEQVFVSASPRSALVLGQARGAALAALGAAGLSVSEYSPAEIKQAVSGNGRAAKAQVQTMVRRLLALDRAPGADAADGLAAAICHAHAARLLAAGARRGAGRRASSRGYGLTVRRPR